MPFASKSPDELGAHITRSVQAARKHMADTGWSYRSAAPVLGITWQHLAHVLTGRRESRSLIARVRSLPNRRKSA